MTSRAERRWLRAHKEGYPADGLVPMQIQLASRWKGSRRRRENGFVAPR
ncbi:hypothetical protein CGMCC3_g8368 [Colletotrichum fructicola]|nr:uncharacterized protein CGMCC3_g8368 [Colletotrichum fructicola]KAE9575524.1 hypothetical protein CGMCC3_g8368 [Colletotrichum fructicola]